MVATVRTFRILAGSLLGAVLASCSGGDGARMATGPSSAISPSFVVSSTQDACWVTEDALTQLLQDALFGGTAPPPDDTLSVTQAARVRLGNALDKFATNPDVALNMAATLKSFLQGRFTQQQFKLLADGDAANDAFASDQLALMLAAIDYLVYAGTQPACPPGVAGPNGGLFFSDDLHAGTAIPPGAVLRPVRITITPSTLLPTDLTQYPLFFRFEALNLADGTPYGPFDIPVDVAVCLDGDPALTPGLDLRLARGTGTRVGDIEILPPGNSTALLDALACDAFAGNVLDPVFFSHPSTTTALGISRSVRDLVRRLGPLFARALLPDPVHASNTGLLGCCKLGGLTGSFSPFGAVDVNSAAIAPAGPTSFEEFAGTSVPARVRLYNKDQGTNYGLRGETVQFAVTGGGGSVSPTTVLTDPSGDGLATAAWTIGPDAGNALTATGYLGRTRAAPPLAIPQVPVPATNGNPVTYTATAVEPLDNFSWSFGVFSSESAGLTALFGTAPLPATASVWSKNPNCSLRADHSWIALRRDVTVKNSWKGVRVTITTDTDVRVWMDNRELSPAGTYVRNQNCPKYTSTTFTVGKNDDGVLRGTSHVVRVLGRDKASNLYFNSAIVPY